MENFGFALDGAWQVLEIGLLLEPLGAARAAGWRERAVRRGLLDAARRFDDGQHVLVSDLHHRARGINALGLGQHDGVGQAVRRVVQPAELVRNGVIGKISHVHVSFSGPGRPNDLPEEAAEPGLDIAAQAKFIAGHSLGEYSALVASGVLTLAQAAPLVRFRAQAMQDAVPVGVGAMAAILGMQAAQVIEGCAEAVRSFGPGTAEVV